MKVQPNGNVEINLHVESAYVSAIAALESMHREYREAVETGANNQAFDWATRTVQTANLAGAVEALFAYRDARGLPPGRAFFSRYGAAPTWHAIDVDIVGLFASLMNIDVDKLKRDIADFEEREKTARDERVVNMRRRTLVRPNSPRGAA